MTDVSTVAPPAAPKVQGATSREFRHDINGLRAWAIVPVVLFHFGVPGFSGGFAGVDVFFVISGFLMTQMICRALWNGDFSLMGFYLARAVRIVPALVVVCAVLVAAGWFALLPPDYKMLGAHTAYSLTFLSDIAFWREAGYFDTSSHEKWLLHTWSLAVEWQFYLLLPLVLMGLARVTRSARAWGRALAVLAVVSLAACVWTTAGNPSAAFFLIHTRAWEMLAGGLVFLAARTATYSPGQRRLIEGAGLVLIAAAILAFDAESAWPGWRAVVPVAGAALVLLATRESVWTGNRFAQWIGLRSYSLYLWHWPVYVFLAYIGLRFNGLALAAGVLASVVLGALSYTFAENPSRRALRKPRLDARIATLVGAAACVALCAAGVWRSNGVAGRFAPRVELAAAAATDVNPERARCHQSAGSTSPACLFGGTERKLFVVGDSHVAAIISSVVDAGPRGAAGVVQLSYDGCVFIPGMLQIRPHRFGANADCKGFTDWAAKQLDAAPTLPVLLAGRYARYAFGPFELDPDVAKPEVYFGGQPATSTTPAFLREFGRHLTETACKLAQTRTVYMMRPIPEMPASVPQYVARRMAWGLDPSLSVTTAQYMQRNGWVWQAQNEARDRCGIVILDPTTTLCHDGVCPATRDGRPLYSDYGHLDEFGAHLLVPVFARMYQPAAPGHAGGTTFSAR
jgi:peptidoglycan/LPS O-acetylase OafA/YrhL